MRWEVCREWVVYCPPHHRLRRSLPSRGSLVHHTSGGKICTFASGRRSRCFPTVCPSRCGLRISSCLMCFSEGPCQSVDSFCVFNTGDDTCGSFTCFCILFSREKRMCQRGMSANRPPQFRKVELLKGLRWMRCGVRRGWVVSFPPHQSRIRSTARRLLATFRPQRGSLCSPEVPESLPLEGKVAQRSCDG